MTTRVGLVTGATGYIGERVARNLLAEGWQVRLLVREADKLASDLAAHAEVIEADVEDTDVVVRALSGVETAWYLVHSMGQGSEFVERDRELAQGFAEAAATAMVSRLVYLGGLHPEGELSPHLASRVEVGQILLASGVPTAVIQAGVVLGPGSASFDMLQALSERLPGAAGPRWLRHRIQPIYIDDVVHFLVAAADLAAQHHRAFDVGGRDVVSYAQMMQRYARVCGLGPRPVITAPVWTPRLASYWIGLITPVSSSLAGPLIESILHETVAHEADLAQLVGEPDGGVLGFDEAIRRSTQGRDPWRPVEILGLVSLTAWLAAHLAGRGQPRSPWRWARAVAWADLAVMAALHLADAHEADSRSEQVLSAGVTAATFAGIAAARHSRPGLVAGGAVAAELLRRLAARPERAVLAAPALLGLLGAGLCRARRR